MRQLHGAEFFRDVIDQMSDGVYFVDRSRKITYWSRGAERLTGYPASEVLGRSCREGPLNHVDELGNELCKNGCPLLATIRDGLSREARVFLQHADGHRHPVWVRAAPLRDFHRDIIGAVEVFSDDTATRAAQARIGELERLALTDPLTGLGNRRYLDRQLDLALREWTQHDAAFGLLFADIDHFKEINDDYGHDVGDDVLAMVARTVGAAVPDGAVVGRYGGEEFVVLCRTDQPGLAAVGERVRGLVKASRLVVGRHLISVTVSLGGAIVSPSDNVDTLLRRADLALHEAKQAGRDQVRI